MALCRKLIKMDFVFFYNFMATSVDSDYISGSAIFGTMPKPFDFLRKPIVYHTFFWASYFCFNIVRWGSYFNDYAYSLQSNLVEFPIHIIIAYFNLYYLMPRLLPGKLVRYLILLTISVLAVSLFRIVITYELVTTDVWREAAVQETSLFDFNYILAVYIGEMYVIGITTAIKLTVDWIKNQRRTRELEKRNLETELSFLKSQIQPHFFFNTLNNLYSLTLDKSEQAPDTVMKLSELMSYVIYEAKNKKVPLMREIKHIQNYIDLERLRYGPKVQVNFDVSGKLEGISTSPLLLIPFVENSFKHGMHSIEKNIPIDIHIEVKDHYLYFLIENLKPEKSHIKINHSENESGIGIENAKRRLNLLFKDDYTLNITNGEKKFKVELKYPVYEGAVSNNR